MNLTFLNPFLLFGLAGVILPILIHRLTRRKAITRKFSAVRLLLQSQRLLARPQRLKNILLLVLRVLAVMGLASMMARPVLIRPGILAAEERGARVVILDNSLSMSYREDRGSRYELAKKAVKEVLVDFQGQVVIIPTDPVQGKAPSHRMEWMPPSEALRELEAIPLSFGRGNLASALSLAYSRLKDLKMPKEILIISDLTRQDWEGFDLSKLGTVLADASVTFLRIGGAGRDSNLTIKGVDLGEGEGVVGVPARLQVTVSNFSDRSESALIQLYISGVKVDQKKIELEKDEDGKIFLDIFSNKSGWLDGEVKLSGDRLPFDDTFYFPLKVREKIKVLIIDGDQRASLKASESYYLVQALNPGGPEGSPFITRVITEDELIDLDLGPYEAIFLLNVSRLHDFKLASFIESGRPGFIFLGDRVVPEEFNRIPFFPWKLKGIKETQRPEKISQIASNHQSLKVLSAGSEGNSLKGALFRRYFEIDKTTKNLLTLEGGEPLLVEADLGRGKLFLFTSSADLDWNDLPLKAAYLPLIQGLLKESVGWTGNALPEGRRIGEPFPEKNQPIQVMGPPGGPGIYKFLLPSGEVRRSVNVPLEESDLKKLTLDELKKKMGKIEVKIGEYQEGTLSGLQGAKRELWPLVLAFLLIILTGEMVLANKA